MKFRVRIAVIIINIVAMFCGLLIFSVTVRDRMELATILPLEENKYKDVNKLIKKYVDAKTNEDFDKLAECVNNIEDYDKEKIKNQNEISESVKNVRIYTIDGYYDNTYIVYLYREDVWKDIGVTVPSIDQLYVCEYKGKLCIYSGSLKDDKKMDKIKKYYELTRYNPNVKTKVQEVNDVFEQLKQSNEKFRKLYETVMKKEQIQSGEATPEPTAVPTIAPTPVPEVSADPNQSIG
jgi:hypothetical protein